MERLKVLFYLSVKLDADPINHELVTRLAHGLAANVDVELHTSASGVDFGLLANYDLVHVFGCWNTTSTQLLHTAYDLHVPSVCSPLGGLQPWIMKAHAHGYSLAAQRKAVQQASAVHVCGKLENELFGKLGWNRRVALIKNPVLTSQLSFDDMAAAVCALYHKVLDTNARLRLSSAACRAIGELVQLGCDEDVLLDADHCKAMKTTLETFTQTDWHNIWIYAADEQITGLVQAALDRLKLGVVSMAVDGLERFDTVHPVVSGHLADDELAFKSMSLSSKLKEHFRSSETNERRLCIALLNYKHEVEHHSASLLHLADLYGLMRFCDTDEDRLKELARELGMDSFVSRLMPVMQSVVRLGEGFMPFVPIDDRQTRLLHTEITKFNTWRI